MRTPNEVSDNSDVREEWLRPEPTDLIFPKLQSELFITEEENLRFDRDGRPRTAYSLRHISMRLMEANIYQIAKNCRTSVEMIEKYYGCTSRTRSTPLLSMWYARVKTLWRKKKSERNNNPLSSEIVSCLPPPDSRVNTQYIRSFELITRKSLVY